MQQVRLVFVERGELSPPSEQIVLQEMRNLSQHASDAALKRYIHAAYKEASAWATGESHWRMRQLHRAMSDSLTELDSLLDAGSISSKSARSQLQHWVSQWKVELAAMAAGESERSAHPSR